MSDKTATTSRRGFLIGAGAASVAGAAAVVVNTAKVDATVKTSKAGIPAGKGYQLSEHVRNYYRTTSV